MMADSPMPSSTAMASDKTPPGWVYALLFLGGSLILWPWLDCWRKGWVRLLLVLHALVPWAMPWFLPLNWLFVAVFWLVWNGGFGLALLAIKPPSRLPLPTAPKAAWLRRGLGAALAVLPLGFVLVALEQWVSDSLWSSFYPVNASLESISFEVLALWQNFALLLIFAGVHGARSGDDFTPVRLLKLLLIAFAGYFLASQAYLGLMAIPAWQLLERQVFPGSVENSRQILYHLVTFVALPLLTATAYRAWIARTSAFFPWLRGMASLVLALLGLSFATGMPIYYALLMGMQHEKDARPEKAIPWYGRALTWSRSDRLNTYLQFHMGLLWRKQGRLDLAHEAFLRVLVRYPHNNDLLVMAHEFQGRLGQPDTAKAVRKVIPGIEARTEYKAAYCVPNSLGLVLNYWGDRTGAKVIGAEITQLEQGSFITDAVHFAERRGLKSIVLPLRDLEDIFKLIDHDFPVLTFIPGHVLAVFGYDRALQTLVTYDVNTVDIWDDQRWTVFQRQWSQDFNVMAVVVPPEKLGEIRDLLGPQVEAQSEAFLQYLLAGLVADNPDGQAKYLGKTAGHGLFFASWQREQLLNRGQFQVQEDSSARRFFLRYNLPETEVLAYLRNLYSTGHCREALDFLTGYSKENALSQTLQIVRAGCLARIGKSDSAATVLTDETEAKTLPSPLIHFLLSEPKVLDDVGLAKDVAADALEQEDGLDGESSGKALRAYLDWLGENPADVEEALDMLEGYVTRHNPFDTVALAALEKLAPRKRFRSDDELEREAFQKRIALYHQRRLSLIR